MEIENNKAKQQKDVTPTTTKNVTTPTETKKDPAPTVQAKPQVSAKDETRPTQQVQPIVPNNELTVECKLIKERLEEYASRVSKATLPGKALVEYGQFHGSFRTLFGLRGEEFKAGFATYISTLERILKGDDGLKPSSLAGDVVCANLNLFSDVTEGRAFISFIVLATSFARSKDRGNFGSIKNVGRLTQHIVDVNLRNSIEECFNVQ